jgi:hypothetical protein
MTQPSQSTSPNPRKRPFKINVRFTPEEYQHIREQAEIVNRKPAAMLRALSMGERLKPVPRLPPDVQRAIKSFGGNLNQLAHQANLGRLEKSQVDALRTDIDALLDAIRS